MTASLHPRLIRPTKDGEEGGWSYLFSANGQDYIFPALVNELGHLKPLIDTDSQTGEPAPRSPLDMIYSTKVIYWKASEWEEKLLPLAVEWTNLYGFVWPDIPYPVMEFRKIEDRHGEDRVTEVVNIAALDRREEDKDYPTLLVHQFTEVGGEEGKGRRPLLQWWMEAMIRFKGPREVTGGGWSVPSACERIADWSDVPGFLKWKIEEAGAAHFFKTLSVHSSRDSALTYDEVRVVTMWIAFCRYITSLKTKYEEGLPQRGRRRSTARTTEEALALEQATIFQTVGVLKSGARRKPIATGTGTKHRYRYLVRGHERIINGKSIWIKPQVRGEGEFLARSIGTDEAIDAAKEIEPKAEVTVEVPAEEAKQEAISDETAQEIVEQVEAPFVDADGEEIKPDEPPPQPVMPQPRSLFRNAVRFLLSLFR